MEVTTDNKVTRGKNTENGGLDCSKWGLINVRSLVMVLVIAMLVMVVLVIEMLVRMVLVVKMLVMKNLV